MLRKLSTSPSQDARAEIGTQIDTNWNGDSKTQKQRSFEPTPKGQPINIPHFEEISSSLLNDAPISIENYKVLVSYSWCKSNESTIFVPGIPARWNPQLSPYQLSKECEQNRFEESSEEKKSQARMPCWTPLFAALQVMQPTYSLRSLSLVIEQNSLRRLFEFVAGKSGKNTEDWRIDVELSNEAMFLTSFVRHSLTGSCNSGYTRLFEKGFLRLEDENVPESLGHHRIVEYDIGGMRWVVRFEVDGYFHEHNPVTTDRAEAEKVLSLAMSTTSLGDILPDIGMFESIKVIHKGRMVAPDALIEVKTKKIGSRSQGAVEHIDKIDITMHFEGWEGEHQEELKALAEFVNKIEEIVKKTTNGRCSVVYVRRNSPQVLQIFEQDSGIMKLSDDLKERSWGQISTSD
ncbi:uncharacterized protein PAC_16145 [Phialocephala subalpina]|uniref:Geranylgeranyl pyrophosphate synthetase n=1 Tax=Phialocephala subalpina TaxID=576137 RepID=A0A1L7XMK2_9HELO|nr:uncharacterized protein PAC_16145 [Phialocephala subalpina]